MLTDEMLARVLEFLPEAVIMEDADGQVVISTNCKDVAGELVPLPEE